MLNTRDATAQGFGKTEKTLYDTIRTYYIDNNTPTPEGVIVDCIIYNNLDFYYQYDITPNYTNVVWKQYNLYQMATLNGHFDRIEEIIPLLYLQQVKVSNNNTVIQ